MRPQPGLALVQREAEYGQALPELGQHCPRLRLPLEADDEIVGIAHDHDTTRHPPPSPLPDPVPSLRCVKSGLKKRRDFSGLWVAGTRRVPTGFRAWSPSSDVEDRLGR